MRYRAASLWQRVFMTSKPRTAFALRNGGALLAAVGLSQTTQRRVPQRVVASVRALVPAVGDRGRECR
jgi:hypothetical protein